jgi:hypothetical protein
VTVIWVGLDGDELVSGHLDGRQKKLLRTLAQTYVGPGTPFPPMPDPPPGFIAHIAVTRVGGMGPWSG